MSASTWTKEQRDLARELHHDGQSHRKIAAAVGQSPSSVGRFLRSSAEYQPNEPPPVPEDASAPHTVTEPPFSSDPKPPRRAGGADGRLLGVGTIPQPAAITLGLTHAGMTYVGVGSRSFEPSEDEWRKMPREKFPPEADAHVVLPSGSVFTFALDHDDIERVVKLVREEYPEQRTADIRALLRDVRPGATFTLATA